jgi:uncharacterized integral membrane protein
MGKVRLVAGIVLIVLLFVFALFNGAETEIRFFLKNWTVAGVPVWGVIYISLVLGIFVGWLLRGGRKHRKPREQ